MNLDTIDTHVCLVSAQPVPNLTPVLDRSLRPRRVILLIAAGMEQRAEWLEEVLRGQGVAVERWPVGNAWDLEQLQQRVLELLEEKQNEVPQGRIALNATGGTKLMSLAAYEVFRAYDLPVFYIHPELDRLLWLHPSRRPVQDLADRIRLEPFLRAHGVRVDGEPRRNVPQPERLEVAREIIRRIDRFESKLGTLNWLAASAENSLCSKPVENDRGILAELIDLFADAGQLERRRGALCFPDESARAFTGGGWLEYLVFDTVRQIRHRDPHIQDVAFNIAVERGDPVHPVRNELDVAFLRNNRLHIIECKTARMVGHEGDTRVAGVLYKLDSLRDLMGGLQARAMVVSFRPLQEHDRQRAGELGIHVCAGEALQQLQEHLKRFAR